MDAQTEQPMAQALVICDQIIEEARTQKKSLIGIFNNVYASTFPVQHPKMCVYASLTNGRGRVKIELRGVRVGDEGSDDKQILSVSGTIEFPDPNQVVEMVFNLNGVPFERPGLHTFELHCEGNLLLEKRFSVAELKQPNQ
jgi:hypothetical protein